MPVRVVDPDADRPNQRAYLLCRDGENRAGFPLEFGVVRGDPLRRRPGWVGMGNVQRGVRNGSIACECLDRRGVFQREPSQKYNTVCQLEIVSGQRCYW